MKTFLKLFSFFFLLGIHCASFAQDTESTELSFPEDSLPGDYYSDFERNLEDLMESWYVQESIGADTDLGEYANDSISFKRELTDTLIMERLNRIPSLVHLTYNSVVRDYINMYTKRKTQVGIMLGLAEYYFPIFEETLDRYGLPLELKYLAIIESALNPRATSRVGATGLWQFMYRAAQTYKLQVDTFIDERCDPFASTDAAARLLRDFYKVYKDWVLVIAAYNCGPGNVNKAIKRSGGKTSYWEIYPYLPRETRGYVPAYIGATYAFTYYKEHGIEIRPCKLPMPTDTIMIRRNVNLAQIAEKMELPIEQLRDLNPQYRREILPGTAAPCPLVLPQGAVSKYIEMEDSIVKYKEEIYLSTNFKPVNPAGDNGAAYVPSGKGQIIHTIRNGETLGGIAKKYGVSVSSIQSWNNMKNTTIVAGRKLTIYTNKSSAPKVDNSKTTNTTSPSKTGTSTTKTGKVVYHEVKSGDSLWSISRQYQGVSPDDIAKWNNISTSTTLKIGTKLKINL